MKKKETIINSELDVSKFKSPADMCLMDDVLMNLVFDNCIEATQEVLRIILERDDIVVKESKAQNNIASGTNDKTVILDILATDKNGYVYDIEVQKVRNRAFCFILNFWSLIVETIRFNKIIENSAIIYVHKKVGFTAN